jgi:hypothetical protein
LLLILVSGTVCFWEHCSTLMNFHALLWLIYWFCFYFYIMMTIIKASCMLCLHCFLLVNFSPSKKKKQEEKKRKYRIKNVFLKAWRAWVWDLVSGARIWFIKNSDYFIFWGDFQWRLEDKKTEKMWILLKMACVTITDRKDEDCCF